MNLGQEHWFFENEGFILTDALIAIAVVSILAVLTQTTIRTLENSEQKLNETYEESNESFESNIFEIGECICETEDAGPAAEETTDISLSSS